MIPSNPAHWHLVLNHLPVVGIFFATVALVLSYFSANIAAKRLAHALVVLAAVLAIPAYLTGEPAEHYLGKFMEVSEDLISPHEEAAEFALISILIAGGLALITLAVSFKKNAIPKFFCGIVFLASLFSLVVLGRTANLGGNIHHQELTAPVPAGSEGSKKDKDD